MARERLASSLIDVDDSILVVIDAQDHFLAKYDPAESASVVTRIVWLVRVAEIMDVPVVAMGEDLANLGPLTAPIAAALPANAVVHDKHSFGLAAEPAILEAVAASGRKTAVLVGMETDVCVAHSALGLVGAGYEVAVVKDAVITTEQDEETGLGRMRAAGVVMTSLKSVFYEWTRTVERTAEVHRRAPELTADLLPGSLRL